MRSVVIVGVTREDACECWRDNAGRYADGRVTLVGLGSPGRLDGLRVDELVWTKRAVRVRDAITSLHRSLIKSNGAVVASDV